MGQRRRITLPLSKRILLIFIILVIVGLVLEGITRLFLSRKLPEPVVPTEIGRFDDRLGWAKIPNARAISNRTGTAVEYRINSKGLRDEETSYEKPAGTFRIVLLGDSYSFGFGVPIKKHFSTLLEGYFEDVEVINMGIDGFGVDQALLYLRTEGLKYEPDLVLAYVPGYPEHRHMHTNRFGKNKPRFTLVAGELILTNSPVTDNVSARPTGLLRKIDRFIVRHSMAYQILHDGLLSLIRRGPTATQQRQGDAQNSDDNSFMNEMHELGLSLIRAMRDDSSDHGAEFVLVTHTSELHETASEAGILSLDVSEPLANPAFALPGNLKHFNESGNGVLAWEVAAFLRGNRLIPARHLGG